MKQIYGAWALEVAKDEGYDKHKKNSSKVTSPWLQEQKQKGKETCMVESWEGGESRATVECRDNTQIIKGQIMQELGHEGLGFI